MTERTATRLQEIRSRTQQKRRRREKEMLSQLTAMSLFLCVGIGVLLQHTQMPGVVAVTDGYGAVLLRNGAEGYIVVGVVAFAVGVALTILYMKWKKK